MTSDDILFDATRIVLRLNIACPTCDQPAGSPCRTRSGRWIGTVHTARDKLALAGLRIAMETATETARSAHNT